MENNDTERVNERKLPLEGGDRPSGNRSTTTGKQSQTADYWNRVLVDSESAAFPALPPAKGLPFIDEVSSHLVSHPRRQRSKLPVSTIVQAAWALVVSQATNSKDVVFGVVTAGNEKPVAGYKSSESPGSILPMRINVQNGKKIYNYLETVQTQISNMPLFEQDDLERTADLGADMQQACMVQTLLYEKMQENGSFGQVPEKKKVLDTNQQNTGCTLILELQHGSDQTMMTAHFDSRAIRPWMMGSLLQQMDHVIQKFHAASSEERISDIETLAVKDREKIWQWNATVPESFDHYVHDRIRERAAHPTDQAVRAWDGELTYGQLDSFATRLARQLVKDGVKPDTIVPLCFEKSMWTTVAMFGVLRSGAAFALMDPSLPVKRLQSMVRETGATVLISSRSNHDLGMKLVSRVVILDEQSMATWDVQTSVQLPVPSPASAAYAIFTSGSTGTPKGTVITHRNISSALHHQKKSLKLTSKTRMFDFTSYSFDISICTVFATLTMGGCVCVPDEKSRRDNLVEAIAHSEANAIILTPSVARLLDPDNCPRLELILFAGEAVHERDVKPWWGRARIINLYGPSECTPVSTLACDPATMEEATRIGKGAGHVTWIVDPENHDRLLPPGCIGELLLEGPLVGRGYLNDLEKTAAAFIEAPSWLVEGISGSRGQRGRLYKTGDLARYDDQDGSLVFVGRKDEQVKLRGQRVELGEVEHWVQACMPKVKRVVAEVIVPQGESSSPMLVAFLQRDEDAPAAKGHTPSEDEAGPKIMTVPAGVESQLRQHLPSYMIPTAFLSMHTLPMTATGKMDRRQLRKFGRSFSGRQFAEVRTAGSGPKRKPSSQAEQCLQKIWASVLGIDDVSIGLDDSFVHLGGDSVAAMKVAGGARKLGFAVGAADIFRHGTLERIAKEVVSLADCQAAGIVATEHAGPVEQSFAQGRLWFLDQLHPGLTWYLIPYAVRLRGPLKLEALDIALAAVERRHESLRTTFSSVDDVNVQHVHPFRAKKLRVVDLDSEEDIQCQLRKDQSTPFDLQTEAGWRVSVYRMSSNCHILSIVMHHIISDGWSADVLRRDLATFYSQAIRGQEDPLSQMDPLPIQYCDYSIWQKQKHQLDEHQRQMEYWVAQLETSRPAELLCDKPRPSALSGQAGTKDVRIEGGLYRRLQEFSRGQDLTLVTTLLAAFRATHFRLTGVDDAVVGIPNANRAQWEIKDVIGFFVNMQCIRTTVQEDESFLQLVHQVHQRTIDSLANQDVPFEQIVSGLNVERDLSRHPLVQMVFALHPQEDLGKFTLENLDSERLPPITTTRFDIEFHFYQEKDALRGQIVFSTDLYKLDTIDNVVSIFYKVLERGLIEPQTAVASLPIFSSTDKTILEEMGLIHIHRTSYPREESIVDVFRQQVAANPERLAIRDSSTELTYCQLDHQSDLLAMWLVDQSFETEALIGVLANRSHQTIIAFLGILKAHMAYLPIDMETPAARTEVMLSSIPGRKLILLGSGIERLKLRQEVDFTYIDDILHEQNRTAASSRAPRLRTSSPSATSLAYVMFTSGSTGQPKGVLVEHRGIVRLAKEHQLLQCLSTPTNMAHISNIAFDAATWEMYVALLNGGTLVCIDRMTVLDYARLPRVFSEAGVNVAVITPALVKQYLRQCPQAIQGLELLYVGGDRFDPEDVLATRRQTKATIVNGYGPTENTTFSSQYRIPDKEPSTNGVPIGRAISNSGVYVMDSRQFIVPLGVVGELVLTGDGLARGYLNPQQNANRFITVTIDGKQVRAYRTGDCVRYRLDGQLEFLGRMDGQVKIRGQRVELGEIEHVLRSHDAVNNAIAVLKQDKQESCVMGFVTLRADAVASEQQSDQDEETQIVDEWEERFDVETYTALDNIKPAAIGRDFMGWVSMYNGKDIDKGEMNEWLVDTIKSLLNGAPPRHVLEIGSGSGMIVFNLLDGLQSYVGLDPSARAV